MNSLVLMIGAVVIASTNLVAQEPDTALYTPVRELRLSLSNVALKRAVSVPSLNESYGNGTLRAIEVFTMGANGGGVRVRYETGSLNSATSSLSTGKYETIAGNLLLGRQEFALVMGYRMFSTQFGSEVRRFDTPEAGLEGGKHFAGAGLMVKAAMMYRMMPSATKDDSLKLDGLEARTSVVYVPPRLPVYVELAYRRDVSAFKKHSTLGVVRREEASAVVLSIGLQSGLSVR